MAGGGWSAFRARRECIQFHVPIGFRGAILIPQAPGFHGLEPGPSAMAFWQSPPFLGGMRQPKVLLGLWQA